MGVLVLHSHFLIRFLLTCVIKPLILLGSCEYLLSNSAYRLLFLYGNHVVPLPAVKRTNRCGTDSRPIRTTKNLLIESVRKCALKSKILLQVIV